ncbi:MAG: TlpA family protein disulfide reductase [bacterium]|nr:TlpA family protein disulfide reductase [bacterium]
MEADEKQNASSDPSDEPQAEQISEASSIQLIQADYELLQQQIAKRVGKIVVVDVWSTSCLPCMREFPNLVALQQKYGDRIACISVNVDYIGLKKKPVESYESRVLDFLTEQNAQLTNLISSETDEELRGKLDISSIPAILIYDATGSLAYQLGEGNSGEDGLTYQGDVVPKVEALLAGLDN